jgi:hypothetical protein
MDRVLRRLVAPMVAGGMTMSVVMYANAGAGHDEPGLGWSVAAVVIGFSLWIGITAFAGAGQAIVSVDSTAPQGFQLRRSLRCLDFWDR